jgi:hypothetical protein
MVDDLFSETEDTLLVPDTNALYWNTALEQWRVPWDSGAFTIVLTPPVFQEIDAHKVDDRQSARRAKAERLARQFGEYRKRGRWLDGVGVPLVAGSSTILAVPVDAVMSE